MKTPLLLPYLRPIHHSSLFLFGLLATMLFLVAGALSFLGCEEPHSADHSPTTDPTIMIVGRWEALEELQHFPGRHSVLVFDGGGKFLKSGAGAERCDYHLRGSILLLLNCDSGANAPHSMRVSVLNESTLIVDGLGDNGGKMEFRRSKDGKPPLTHYRAAGYAPGSHVLVSRFGMWRPGEVVSVLEGRFLIHFDGSSADDDEWVPETAIHKGDVK